MGNISCCREHGSTLRISTRNSIPSGDFWYTLFNTMLWDTLIFYLKHCLGWTLRHRASLSRQKVSPDICPSVFINKQVIIQVVQWCSVLFCHRHERKKLVNCYQAQSVILVKGHLPMPSVWIFFIDGQQHVNVCNIMINGLNALTVSFTEAILPSPVLSLRREIPINVHINWKAH